MKLCTDSSLISSLSCSEIESNCCEKKPLNSKTLRKFVFQKFLVNYLEQKVNLKYTFREKKYIIPLHILS